MPPESYMEDVGVACKSTDNSFCLKDLNNFTKYMRTVHINMSRESFWRYIENISGVGFHSGCIIHSKLSSKELYIFCLTQQIYI